MATVVTGTNSGAWGLLNERLIVSRMQDHIVVTADGDCHMLVNLGLNGGLTMFTSTDGGETWSYSFSMPDTDKESTSDIQLMVDGETLIVAYLNADNQVVYAEYDYDTEANSWSLTMSSVADTDALDPSVHPTVTITDTGRAIITYTEMTEDGLRAVVKASYGEGHDKWVTIENMLETENGSARVITAGDKTGILYTTADGMFWASLDDDYHLVKEQVLDSTTPGMYASHFSTTVFGDDIYVATPNSSGNLVFVSYDGATDTWSEPRLFLQPDLYVTSAQISVNDKGNLYIVFDDEDQPNLLIVMESTDGGLNWHHEATLVCPIEITDPPTRFETPDQFTGDLIVMQQILNPDNPSQNGLYSYVVDVDGDNEEPVTAVGVASEAAPDLMEPAAPSINSPPLAADPSQADMPFDEATGPTAASARLVSAPTVVHDVAPEGSLGGAALALIEYEDHFSPASFSLHGTDGHLL